MRAAAGRLAALGAALALLSGSALRAESEPAANPDRLEAIRRTADIAAQRRHVWSVFEELIAARAFETWRGEGEVFGTGAARGIAGFSRPVPQGPTSVGAPVLNYTLYNDAAFDHIRANGLARKSALERIRASGDAAVPAFPTSAVVIKTAWWPVARDRPTAMPVWDPETNPPERAGNAYLGWRRSVTVGPDLDAFHHVTVDAQTAAAIMRDPESRRAVTIALGRPLQAGDALALVGVNLMTRELHDWVWAAFWWHDRAGEGAFAAQRPASLSGPWRNYLMQPAFDALTPAAGDGGAHVAFNPWLEGRFPDGGRGGGAKSNCLACHARASYPAVAFLPVTRGAPDVARDPAFGKAQVSTSFLWSLAMHAQP